MFLSVVNCLEEVARYSRYPAILPGQPEPAWLRRNAEYRRVLATEAAGAERSPGERRGLVARVRFAFGRS
jgi:hypothetical protein